MLCFIVFISLENVGINNSGGWLLLLVVWHWIPLKEWRHNRAACKSIYIHNWDKSLNVFFSFDHYGWGTVILTNNNQIFRKLKTWNDNISSQNFQLVHLGYPFQLCFFIPYGLGDVTMPSWKNLGRALGNTNIPSSDKMATGRVTQTCSYKQRSGWRKRFATSAQTFWSVIRLIWHLESGIIPINKKLWLEER